MILSNIQCTRDKPLSVAQNDDYYNVRRGGGGVDYGIFLEFFLLRHKGIEIYLHNLKQKDVQKIIDIVIFPEGPLFDNSGDTGTGQGKEAKYIFFINMFAPGSASNMSLLMTSPKK